MSAQPHPLRQSITLALSVLVHARDVRLAQHRAKLIGLAVLKASAGEGWAESDPALPKIEARSIAGLLSLWRSLEKSVLDVLGLPTAKAATKAAGPFAFSAVEHLRGLLQYEQAFITAAGSDAGPLVREAFAAWLRGIENARDDVPDVDADVTTDVRRAYRASLQTRGMELVRNGIARTYREGIIDGLTSGEFDGMNPVEVAAKLRKRFAAGDYNWERLARSEIAMAQVDGKAAEYAAMGVTQVEYVTARDGRVSQICISNAAGNPYPIASAPVPVRDSHPQCRCSWKPVIDD